MVQIYYMSKICTGCGSDLPIRSFSKKKSSKDGRNTRCRKCRSDHYQATKDECRARNQRWIEANRGRRRQHQRNSYGEYYLAIEKPRRQTPEYKARRANNRAAYAKTPHFRITNTVRHRIWQSLKSKKNGRSWEALVGYTLEELITHLELLFVVGMSWDNYGTHWHIDHKHPVSLFEITSSECDGFRQCWSLDNLQPLWKQDNLRKGNRPAA